MWRLIRFVPNPVLAWIKRNTNQHVRLWIRRRFGASASSIVPGVRRMPDGRSLHVEADEVYWAIAHGLEYEPEATAFVRAIVPPGADVLDVGANFGWFTTLLGTLVGPSGRVIAIEASPSTVERLRANVALNGLERIVHVHPGAVGDRSGTVELHVFPGQSHACASLSDYGKPDAARVTVPISTLDTIVPAGFSPLFLKMDIEGAELLAIRGGASWLRSLPCLVALVELNAEAMAAFGYGVNELLSALDDAGLTARFTLSGSTKLRAVTEVAHLNAVAGATGVGAAGVGNAVPGTLIAANAEGVRLLESGGFLEVSAAVSSTH